MRDGSPPPWPNSKTTFFPSTQPRSCKVQPKRRQPLGRLVRHSEIPTRMSFVCVQPALHPQREAEHKRQQRQTEHGAPVSCNLLCFGRSGWHVRVLMSARIVVPGHRATPSMRLLRSSHFRSLLALSIGALAQGVVRPRQCRLHCCRRRLRIRTSGGSGLNDEQRQKFLKGPGRLPSALGGETLDSRSCGDAARHPTARCAPIATRTTGAGARPSVSVKPHKPCCPPERAGHGTAWRPEAAPGLRRPASDARHPRHRPR